MASDSDQLKKLIDDVTASGGAEMANAQPFIMRLTEALGLPQPDFAKEENRFNDYVFERSVDFKHPDGTTTKGRIDCYKRDCFVLEAKQSAKRKKTDPAQIELLSDDEATKKLGHAKQGTRQWDKVMAAARKQAEGYARALPVEHGYPPFLLIVDVGNVIEIYADFSGQGKNYAQFPDRKNFRITMDDLADADVQSRLQAIWTDPLSLDPAKKSAEVTRDIAKRLAEVAKFLEGKHDAKDVAEFLMRCLFTMFAEDAELLPKDSFVDLLESLKDKPDQFVPAMENLWRTMDAGGYEPRMMQSIKRFNGSLFKDGRALPLPPEAIHELYVAARQDWRDVEPAIFGTLLERALDPRERSKLGAHYTPRAYVERLVVPTIIEPLRADWEMVQSRAQELIEKGKLEDARQVLGDFHHMLCTTRVLDPACGTGNFLYVSLELMKKLEGEVLEALEGTEADIGFGFQGETVNPAQFYGLELNPRAVPIADLVLWIGFIKWQLKTYGLNGISEPILHAYGTIKQQDAILAYDRQDMLRDENGKPLSRWDGVTKKRHPITGEEIPDPDATIELYAYTNPRPADWPEAEFIVGNPPFIGGKDMRAELGDGYAEATWKARKAMPGGADFVMHFWDEAATRLARKGTAKKPNPLRRFGFITTNSITQTFSRRIIERHLSAKEAISLTYATPDHPWMKASDKAAVRIAMTVAQKGEHEGVLAVVKRESGLNTDAPVVELDKREGKITGKLTLGADLAKLNSLFSNSSIGHKGFMPYGKAFFISYEQALAFGLGKIQGADQYLRPYLNGRDLNQHSRGIYCLDFHETTEEFVRNKFPVAYQYLLGKSKPERAENKMEYRRKHWWRFGQPSTQMREALTNCTRFIGTSETARHRLFRFMDGSAAPDQKIRVLATEGANVFACVSSRLHVTFSIQTGGWQGVGNDPVYQHTATFDPFPFPACVTDDSNPALTQRLEELGERLDAFRKERLAAHDFLTMTGMYNVLERVRELEAGADVEPLSDSERDIYDAALIGVLKDIHDEIDRATFEAYGWQDLADRLVGKPGATMPSPHKSADQEAAEEALLQRLVDLNVERQKEEARGIVRWLRPDYQIPKLGHKVARPDEMKQIEGDLIIIAGKDKPKWPSDGLAQFRLVKDTLAKAPAPATPDDISAVFSGGRNRRDRVEEVLQLLAESGGARTGQMEGETRYFVPR